MIKKNWSLLDQAFPVKVDTEWRRMHKLKFELQQNKCASLVKSTYDGFSEFSGL